jgi:hypothetical protein
MVCNALVSIPEQVYNTNWPTAILSWTLTGATADDDGIGQIGDYTFDEGTTVVTYLVYDDISSNTATCSFNVIVNDDEDPTISCTNVDQTADPGACNANVTIAIPTNNDNCQVVSVTNDYNGTGDASDNYPLGFTTVTWTVLDATGNSAQCSQTVTITDDEAPTALCKPITVQLDASANVSILPSDVDNGSSDLCGSVSLSVMPSVFDCTKEGVNNVTLTVIDESGNSAFCTTTVEVIRPPLTLVWTGAEDDNWSIAGNWDLDCVPRFGDQVIIPVSPAIQPVVYADDEGYAANVRIESGAHLTVNGTLYAIVESGAAVNNIGTVTVTGQFFFNGGDFINDGLLTGNGTVKVGNPVP